MNRIKIAIVALVAVGRRVRGRPGGQGDAGERAAVELHRQRRALDSWTWFYEDDDGTLVGFSVSVCTTPMNGYDVDPRVRSTRIRSTTATTPGTAAGPLQEPMVERREAGPSPTPTPTSTTTGTTSGTYDNPTETPRPMTTTSGTRSTSGTVSR